jgi:hypothetical protein
MDTEELTESGRLFNKFLKEEEQIKNLGCVVRALDRVHEFYTNKNVNLNVFFNTQELRYLKVEPEANVTKELEKEYFLSNEFTFIGWSEVSNWATRYEFKGHDLSQLTFYILYNCGSGGDFECCASIILRYSLH